MEKKKDYNYLIELFNEWEGRKSFELVFCGIDIFEIRQIDGLVLFGSKLQTTIEWLEEQLKPTYEDALKFISDNEDKEAKFYVYYSTNSKKWVYCIWHSFTPFTKYMTEEKCKEFIEKFKNVKPKA